MRVSCRKLHLRRRVCLLANADYQVLTLQMRLWGGCLQTIIVVFLGCKKERVETIRDTCL